MAKTIWVLTNDPDQPKHRLTMSGNVDKVAKILPGILVNLTGDPENEIKQTITVIPEEKYPFRITDVSTLKGTDITFEFSEKKSGSHGRLYLLTVENARKSDGRYSDTVILKTTSTIQPEIKIRVFGNIRKTMEQAPAL
ncbi:MAG: hypothetical protein R6U50_10260 [Desulfobacterales bacterium]